VQINWETLTEDVLKAIAETLEAELPDVRVQTLEELSDGYQDLPMLQVHWMGDVVDPWSRQTDRTTFQGLLKQVEKEVELWVFSHSESLVGENAQVNAQRMDELTYVLLLQGTTLFGTTGSPKIRSFRFRATPVRWTLQRGHAVVGARVTLTLRIF
jgi:hypothetical protein